MLPFPIGYVRKARYNIYTYTGKWLGDVFALSEQDACQVAQKAGSPVAYARYWH